MRPIPGTITDPAVDSLLGLPTAAAPNRRPALLRELAHALAKLHHEGQTRKGSDEPYIRHVERVAQNVHGDRAKTIAFLHDLIEDTRITPDDLLGVGFGVELVTAVLRLTRVEGETYSRFLDRAIKSNDLDVIAVKLEDVRDNMNDPWVRGMSSMRARYVRAFQQLLHAQYRLRRGSTAA